MELALWSDAYLRGMNPAIRRDEWLVHMKADKEGVIDGLQETNGHIEIYLQYDLQVYYLNEKITLAGWIRKFDLQADKADFFSDGVHPSKITYQTWAKDLAKASAGMHGPRFFDHVETRFIASEPPFT